MSKSVGTQTFAIGLIGAAGYAGQIFEALALQHENLELTSYRGHRPDALSDEDQARLCASDAVVLAIPGEAAETWVPYLRERGVRRILDLSDHYRRDPEFHYGIPELFGAPKADAQLVANPGCYPTATLLALKPLASAGLIELENISVLGASGATGAGKNPNDVLHFCHLAENTFPYKVGEHRHIPEIEHHLGAKISFVTQLLPIQRGILLTAFIRPKADIQELRAAWELTYAGAPYVTVLPAPDRALGLRNVSGTHQAFLAIGPQIRSGTVPVFCSIDNLMRGAASQAMHTLNLWLGLPFHRSLPPPQKPCNEAPRAYAWQSTSLAENFGPDELG